MSEIKVDTVAEKTSANGVTVDGLNIKDGKLTTATAITGQTAEATVANDDLVLVSDTSASGALKKMTVANLTANAGVAGISSSADATAITIDSSENVGIGISPTPPTAYGGLHIHSTYPVMKLSSTSTGSGTGDGFVARIDSTPRVELWNFENSDMVFATNNTERMRIRAGGGLAIGGTGDANTLDDYEEGTFTPAFGNGAGLDAINHQTQEGNYVKIGNLVMIRFRLKTQSASKNSNGVQITGLPFTSNANQPNGAAYIGFMDSDVTNSTTTNLHLYINNNATTINLYKGNGSEFTGSDFNNEDSLNIQMVGQYEV